ncbi:MAG TPA: DUF4905 domain-containing protein, partial [Roseivirga sp.]
MKSTDEYLLVNTRDNESLCSKFSLVNLKNAEVLWQDLQFEDEWWVSPYHFFQDQIVFQKFEDTQNIDDRSVFGFDIIQQETLWSLENIKLTGARDEQLFLQSESGEPLIFNITTQSWEEEMKGKQSTERVSFPIHYDAENKYFKTLAEFLNLQVGIDLEGSCDYLEEKGLIFIAANHVNKGLKSLTLYVFDDSGNLLLIESLESGVKGLVSGA